jgi:hypothetical protein
MPIDNNTQDKMFCPPVWSGPVDDFQRLDIYPWVSDIKKNFNVYCHFWTGWDDRAQLPLGHDFYIISYHIENVNRDWLIRQRARVDGKIIVLFPGNIYDFKIPGVDFITYIDWHRDLDHMIKWHGVRDLPERKKFKYSAVCNRVTQSKIWVTTKLLETADTQSLIYINNWLEEKNVHGWQYTGNPNLDALTNIYRSKYINLKISDGFSSKDNKQLINSNPWQPLYTDCALHFTNGSFHYSYMLDENSEPYVYSGPDIDEKTLKCLLAGIPFIACGQFEIYKTLTSLGFEFDYGFDLSWDNDPGNISRFDSICSLIDKLNDIGIYELIDLTKKSTDHNKKFITTGGFQTLAEKKKMQSVEKIFSILEVR